MHDNELHLSKPKVSNIQELQYTVKVHRFCTTRGPTNLLKTYTLYSFIKSNQFLLLRVQRVLNYTPRIWCICVLSASNGIQEGNTYRKTNENVPKEYF